MATTEAGGAVPARERDTGAGHVDELRGAITPEESASPITEEDRDRCVKQLGRQVGNLEIEINPGPPTIGSLEPAPSGTQSGVEEILIEAQRLARDKAQELGVQGKLPVLHRAQKVAKESISRRGKPIMLTKDKKLLLQKRAELPFLSRQRSLLHSHIEAHDNLGRDQNLQLSVAHKFVAPTLEALSGQPKSRSDPLQGFDNVSQLRPRRGHHLQKARNLGPKSFKMKSPAHPQISRQVKDQGAMIGGGRAERREISIRKHHLPIHRRKHPVQALHSNTN
ncbi:hypothetical protein BRADI_2g24866v3 [Brachypodium distachyon]|uniref:Uncharacterized protein n=1 Tax=Brachypodium distachyon TaxID=15368 RepID=A0A2K2DAA7_BRADI|nr:hypothetical protein BRADI_2g24866v3 [Brachypodium distachyon]